MSVRQLMWTDNRQTMERKTAEFLAGLNHIPEGTEAKKTLCLILHIFMEI